MPQNALSFRRRVTVLALALVTAVAVVVVPGTAADAAGQNGRFGIETMYSHGAWNVDRTRTFTLYAQSKHRPQYIDAAPFPQRPRGADYVFQNVGKHQWSLQVTMNRSLRSHTYWNLGVRTGHKTHRLKIRPLGKNDPRGLPLPFAGSGPHQG